MSLDELSGRGCRRARRPMAPAERAGAFVRAVATSC
jgi:hypothetical protein